MSSWVGYTNVYTIWWQRGSSRTLLSELSPYNGRKNAWSHIDQTIKFLTSSIIEQEIMMTQRMMDTVSTVDIEKYKTTELKSIWRKPASKPRYYKTASGDYASFFCSRRKLIRSLSGEFIAIKEVPLRIETVPDDQIRMSLPNILNKLKQIQVAFILDREIGK